MSSSAPPVSSSTGTTNSAPSPAQAEPMSPVILYLKTYIMRFFQTLGRWCDLYLSTPLPSPPAFTIRIPSTVSATPGKIPLLFYTPKSYPHRQAPAQTKRDGNQQKTPLLSRKKHPILINMHGGGYTIGHPADDARWATQITNSRTPTPPVVISIGYRLAPSHPFPTGIEDCVSTILYLWAHASEYDLDPSQTTLSGFSAGGQFCFSVLYRLHAELASLRSRGELDGETVGKGKVVSLVAFYPPTDWSKARAERTSTNPNFQPMVPPFFQIMVEQAYLPPRERREMTDPLISPGLARDQLVREALPRKLVIITCWADGLLGEGEAFRERLKRLGKKVEGYTVKGVPHGWDKWPSWWRGNPSRDEAYAKAAGWLLEHLEEEAELR